MRHRKTLGRAPSRKKPPTRQRTREDPDVVRIRVETRGLTIAQLVDRIRGNLRVLDEAVHLAKAKAWSRDAVGAVEGSTAVLEVAKTLGGLTVALQERIGEVR